MSRIVGLTTHDLRFPTANTLDGLDVFGSDICTCQPYLVHGIKDAIETAQQGGTGLIVYNRKVK